MRRILVMAAVASGSWWSLLVTSSCDMVQLGHGYAKKDGGTGLSQNDGLPCEVAGLMQNRCDSCHGGASPSAGLSLVSRDDLAAASGTGTVADLCLARMKDSAKPMPPAGLLAAAEIAPFEKWISDGMPQGTCATADPTKEEPVCTSGKTNTSSAESPDMQPGKSCIACHASDGEAPLFTLAGTVYPTFHEPDQCVSEAASAQVIVTDADGKKVTMDVSAASGNFSSFAAVKFPVTAEIVDSNGKRRPMATGVQSGDCNACHTQSGTQGAPGRVRMP